MTLHSKWPLEVVCQCFIPINTGTDRKIAGYVTNILCMYSIAATHPGDVAPNKDNFNCSDE